MENDPLFVENNDSMLHRNLLVEKRFTLNYDKLKMPIDTF